MNETVVNSGIPDILPCPFCRGTAEVKELQTTAASWWYVCCVVCKSQSGSYRPAERAIEEWNRRGYAGERQLITEDWLRSVGFKWAQFDRQPEKQWILWIGNGILEPDGKRKLFSSDEDLGIQLGAHYRFEGGKKQETPDYWSCFFRGDTAGRYHRFIHLRYLLYQDQLISLVEALSGSAWNPANHIYGSLRTPEHAAHLREEEQRLDRRILQHPWTEAYKDPDRAKPLLEHVDAAVKGGLAK